MEDYTRKQQQQHNRHCSTFKVLLLLLATNVVSVYLATTHHHYASSLQWLQLSSSSCSHLAAQLNSTNAELAGLRRRLADSTSLIQSLLAHLDFQGGESPDPLQGGEFPDPLQSGEVPEELRLAVGPHKLPLGHTPNIGSDQIYLSLGAGCRHLLGDVGKYMTYPVGGECPSDDIFAQRLMLQGCEPLPRRRCHPKSPRGYVEPRPVPASLWATPPDTSIVWDPYTCKNYGCLVNRYRDDPRSYDCKDCFDMGGREASRWLHDTSSVDYGIDAVLAYRSPGTVRIGLDLGGGSGTFAARMRERNVTMVTTSMNFDGPFNSFIASRGLVPLHISISHRLPFFENTLDIIHSMHVLSNWIPDMVLEFALYDIYRVLRPGGLFWLDHFFCLGDQLNATYVPMFGRIGFHRLRWNLSRKLDRGVQRNEWYLSALLEKPMT